MFGSFQWQEFVSAFVVLFAVIDITGSIPVILTLKNGAKNKCCQGCSAGFDYVFHILLCGRGFSQPV